jgi:hypothetical protein
VPQGSTTTARNQGAVSAPYRFDDYTALLFSHVRGALAPLSSLPTYMRLDVYPPIHWRADRASSAASNHALQLAATDLEYEVTRVKSPVLGRDLNPMGRGDGTYYANGGNSSGGSIAVRGAKPSFTGNRSYGYGNDVNNDESESKGPNPNCFSMCICAADCFLEWQSKDKEDRSEYPTDCCNEDDIATMVGCCMGVADRQDSEKVAAFIADCLGCSGEYDIPTPPEEPPEESECCELRRGSNYREYTGICRCIGIGQDQFRPGDYTEVTGMCLYQMTIDEPIQHRVKCNSADPHQVKYGQLIGWINVTAVAIYCSLGCSIGTSITIPGSIEDGPKVPPANVMVDWATSFMIPAHASFPAVCGDDYEKQEYGFYLALVSGLSDKPTLAENCGGGICQRSLHHPEELFSPLR